MLYYVKQLMNIMYFINLNPNKRIIATGDSDQSTPFTNILNQYEYPMKQYLYNCVYFMFPNQLTLCINKRLKNEEDNHIIAQVKNELFKKNNVPIDILQKYFKVITNIKDLQTTNNICYYNYRRKYINKYVFNKLVFKNKYNNSQISIYTDEKKQKCNMFLSKKVNFGEYEDIVYCIDRHYIRFQSVHKIILTIILISKKQQSRTYENYISKI